MERRPVRLTVARPGAAGRWLARALSQLETDRPWYERMRDAYLRKLAGQTGGRRRAGMNKSSKMTAGLEVSGSPTLNTTLPERIA